MSTHNQNNQRLRRNGSPSTKQGPIRATQQFAFTSPSRGIVRSSPTSSPVSKESKGRTRPLSETGILTSGNGRRSPSSPCGFRIVEKPKPLNANRSSSFDNGMAAPYLSGQWPKDGHWQQQKDTNVYNPCGGIFTADKQTQTPEEWEDTSDRRRGPASKIGKSRSQSAGSGDQQLKNIKHKLQRNGGIPPPSTYQQRLSPVLPTNNCLPATPSSSMPIKIPISTSSTNGLFVPPRGTPGKARGSVEGLNQEVEKLIISGRKLDASESVAGDNLDGHRAPVFELLAQTSVDTQTPNQGIDYTTESLPVMLEECKDSADSSHDSDESPFGSSRDDDEEEEGCRSVSPSFIPGQFELEDSTLLQQTDELEGITAPPSPQPNSEFVRLPPDGAEKIKIIDELSVAPKPVGFTHQLLVPSKAFQPSATSAFQCLPAVYRRSAHSPLAIIEDAH